MKRVPILILILCAACMVALAADRGVSLALKVWPGQSVGGTTDFVRFN